MGPKPGDVGRNPKEGEFATYSGYDQLFSVNGLIQSGHGCPAIKLSIFPLPPVKLVDSLPYNPDKAKRRQANAWELVWFKTEADKTPHLREELAALPVCKLIAEHRVFK